ncbi:MAG: Aspartyl/glutamyl-tRNA(Asn/Gln) amidotransferase subunit B [Eubacteriales bacterium SKADARSKE-1]|nr:Aspartyl/glutamyl-tRNA(Asn/Gln) amidotransferase subunit B [Eubacteriales bacterium SKADARSKE-1]
MSYEIVCGIETHVELSTNSKIFCSCPVSFGKASNTNVCPICLGLPGTLPHFNEKVLDYAIMAGLATNCEISDELSFDRKNYFYPDLPKGFQITQHHNPLCKNGYIELSSGKKIRINHIHIEEDAGKLIHKDGKTFIDYNRSGIPLIEIVSEPDISSPDEALEYVKKLQHLMQYLGISDCKMQEGSLRCDINVSVKKAGDKELNTKTEIKNINSTSFIAKAIEQEAARQIEVLENGKGVISETRRYNELTQETESMRKKEKASDYRYFKEPDLPTIKISLQKVTSVKKLIPENPDLKINRYIDEFKLSKSQAATLAKYKNVADYFETACENIKNKNFVANFITSQIFSMFNTESEKQKFKVHISALDLNKLMKFLDNKETSQHLAKTIFNQMIETKKSFDEIITTVNTSLLDENATEKLCLEAVEKNQKAFSDYKSGREKAIDTLLSYVVKESNGKVDIDLAKKFFSGYEIY